MDATFSRHSHLNVYKKFDENIQLRTKCIFSPCSNASCVRLGFLRCVGRLFHADRPGKAKMELNKNNQKFHLTYQSYVLSLNTFNSDIWHTFSSNEKPASAVPELVSMGITGSAIAGWTGTDDFNCSFCWFNFLAHFSMSWQHTALEVNYQSVIKLAWLQTEINLRF